ncbi:MAG TPA: hypothetical protein VEP46_10425 [Vicinamibacterales bacterium]|nr:hypothetical protein [Vicinamibacterales bacterium]
MRNTTCAVILLISTAFAVSAHAADGTLAAARELYVSASYDDALSMLSGLTAGSKSLEEQQSIDLYRTLCFFALGRAVDADRVIEGMLMRQPLFRASTEELSPRVQSAFQTARRRILPGVIQRVYAEAKNAFDRQDYVTASGRFDEVLKSLADPDITAVAAAPPLADLRTLASSFRDLSVKLTPPPAAPKLEANPVRPVRSVYSADDRDVVAPVALQQRVPKYPANVTKPMSGVLEFVVDETGAVQAPMMLVSIDSTYDPMVVSAAKKWMYKPASVDGKPVKYIKRLTISVSVSAPQ